MLAAAAEPGVTLVRLEDFERENPDVLAIKDTRSLRDYYFTLSGCLSAWMLRQAKRQEVLTYVDADLYFYASPAPLFAAMENASVGLVGHRHHWWTKRLEKFGRFNVGWVSFRSDPIGWLAANWWRERCIDWCYGIADGDRFADQKYLDHMFAKFPKVIEIAHPGANIGPWNVSRHKISRDAGESFVVDGGFPLIFVHYSGVSKAGRGFYQCSNVSYLGPFPRLVRKGLYAPLSRRARTHPPRARPAGQNGSRRAWQFRDCGGATRSRRCCGWPADWRVTYIRAGVIGWLEASYASRLVIEQITPTPVSIDTTIMKPTRCRSLLSNVCVFLASQALGARETIFARSMKGNPLAAMSL